LVERGYVPRSDEQEKLAILGADVADLIASIEHNLDPNASEPFYQRKVSYDNLPAAYLPELRALVRQEAQKLLEKLNREMAKQDRDFRPRGGANPKTAEGDRHRAMIGVYFYQEELGDED
jgi:hypothetical protein